MLDGERWSRSFWVFDERFSFLASFLALPFFFFAIRHDYDTMRDAGYEDETSRNELTRGRGL